MDQPGFDILLEDGPCLVVNKPGGVLTQAPPNIDSLELRVRRYLREREQRSGNFYLAVAHRLDRPVSGAVAMARNVRSARRLCEQFQRREVTKTYWALVEGIVAEQQGPWVDWLRKVPEQPRAELLAADHPDARDAVLHFQRLERREHTTLLEIVLETGRMHQIRVQAAARGHPICGDEMYGAHSCFGPLTPDPRARCIALHAGRLQLRHPMTKLPLDIHAPLPEYWRV